MKTEDGREYSGTFKDQVCSIRVLKLLEENTIAVSLKIMNIMDKES